MDRPEKASFGEVLRRYRRAAGLSQEALAERAQMSAEGISALERGTRQAPYRDTVRLLATALGLSAAERADLERTIVRARGVRPRATPAASEDDSPPPVEGHVEAPPQTRPMAELPTGTVTFLFADVEGSIRPWERHSDGVPATTARHAAIVEEQVARRQGVVVRPRGEGDSSFAVFTRASDAVAAAAAIQQALHTAPWPLPTPLRVRIALYTGEAELRDGDYYGAAVNRGARLRALAHGGQVLVSQATHALVCGAPPEEVGFIDLGEHHLRDLAAGERVFQLVAPGLPEAFPPLRSLDRLPNNLPRQLTTFVGRERALAEVRELLAAHPLVTLTGSGGCGKTRLALQVAADVVDAYADGVWLVELAPLSDPDLAAPTVANVLGVQRPADRPILAHLVDALRTRRLLLILDNCEHLVDACAALADALLGGCPGVRILATSREALRIAGETSWRVPSLDVPPGDHLPPLGDLGQVEAVRLFVDRAEAALPGFALTGQNAAAVAEICRRLDGIPLALELAAPRLQGLSAEQLAARLDRRFQLLTTGSRTALPRQQTLVAAVSWSFDLLNDAERTLFARLAVFTGGFTLEAAETVGGGVPLAAADVLGLLLRLIDKSLVVAEVSEKGVARYRLLETLRQFGWEKLRAAGEADSLGERHARYYLAQAEEGERGLRGRDQVDWLWRLEADHDNLRAGLTWLERRGQVDTALRLAGVLAVFWAIRGYYAEGRAHLERLLARPEVAESWAERGKALWGLGRLADRQGDFGVVRACFEESRACAARAGDRETIIRALIGLGKWAVNQDDRRAGQWLDEALARARELGEPWAIAAALGEKVVREVSQGNLALAQSLGEERLAMARQIGDTWEVNFALHVLEQAVLAGGDCARARVLCDEKLAIARALGDRSSIATTLGFLGQVDAAQGDPELARARFLEGLAIYRDRGDQDGIAFAAGNLCELALSQGDLGAARAFAAECLTAARVPGAEKLATALLCNGDVALARGDFAAAEVYLAEALALLGPTGRPGPTAQILQGFARVAAARNQPVRALRLAGRAATLRGWNPHRLASIDLALLERALRPLHDAPGGLSSDEQAAVWAEGEAMTPEQAAAYALSREE